MSFDLDGFLAEDQPGEFYPGSKKRRSPKVAAHPSTSTPVPVEEWGDPVIKYYKGRNVELWPISGLANALGKAIVTVRMWERKGYIPNAPFRLAVEASGGPSTAGRRYYTRELIESIVDEFGRRGLLNKARVEWSEHRDLPVLLQEEWDRISAEL